MFAIRMVFSNICIGMDIIDSWQLETACGFISALKIHESKFAQMHINMNYTCTTYLKLS